MTVANILDRREDQRLEFASATVLATPEAIAREVVGMMNAAGGEIWIGVDRDDEGAPRAINPVIDPAREKARLLDYLRASIDPPPTSAEVTIEVEALGSGDRALLVVHVQPPAMESGRLPVALVRQGGRHYLRRAGTRSHPMSREEIFGEPASMGNRPADDAVQKLVAARTAFRDSGQGGLWVALQPAKELAIDLEDARFERIALDPPVSGNRRAGWHFARSIHLPERPRIENGLLHWGLWYETLKDYVSRVEVQKAGGLRFWASLRRLHWKGGENEIWPLALLEYPISAFRIAREIYRGYLEPEDSVAANLALFGVTGWELRLGTPGDYFLDPENLRSQDEPDLIWEPDLFSAEEIERTPDHCGFLLVSRVYQAFGIAGEDMPRQYDRETGRLILPE